MNQDNILDLQETTPSLLTKRYKILAQIFPMGIFSIYRRCRYHYHHDAHTSVWFYWLDLYGNDSRQSYGAYGAKLGSWHIRLFTVLIPFDNRATDLVSLSICDKDQKSHRNTRPNPIRKRVKIS